MSVKVFESFSSANSFFNMIENVCQNSENHFSRKLVISDVGTKQFENILFNITNGKGAMGFEVVSKINFLKKVDLLFDEQCVLANGEAVLQILKACEDVCCKLNCFQNQIENIGFAQKMLDVINDFINHLILPQDVLNGIDSFPKHLEFKLNDVALIYQSLMQNLKNEGKILPSQMSEKIAQSLNSNTCNLQKDIIILYDCQKNLNLADEMLISSIISKYDNVNFSVVGDKTNTVYKNSNFNMIKQVCSSHKKTLNQFCDEVVLKDDFLAIKNNMFSYNECDSKKSQNVYVVKANDVEDEINFITAIIREKTKQGYNLEDMAVMCQDKAYNLVVEKVFKDNQVEWKGKMDYEVSVCQLSKLIKSVVVFANSKIEDVSCFDFCEIVKNPIMQFSQNEIADFENFLKTKTVKEVFDIVNKDDEEILIHKTVKKVMMEILEFSQKFKASGNVIDIILKNLKEQSFVENLNGYLKKIAVYDVNGVSVLKNCYSKMIKNCEEMQTANLNFYGNLEKTFAMFFELLPTISVDNKNSDCVFVGSVEDLLLRKFKILFVIGAVSGAIPQITKDNGILSEKVIMQICQNANKKVCDLISQKNNNAMVMVLSTFCNTSDELYVTMPRISSDGKCLAESAVVGYLQKIFKNVELSTKVLEIELLSSFDESNFHSVCDMVFSNKKNTLTKVLQNLNYNKNEHKMAYLKIAKDVVLQENYFDLPFINEKLNGQENSIKKLHIENAKKLFFSSNNIGVTQIENFYGCPYKHFVQNGLSAKEEEDGTFDAKRVGIFFHKIAEMYVERCLKTVFEKDESDKLVTQIVSEILQMPEYLEVLKNEIEKKKISGLIDEAKRFCYAIRHQINYGEFEVVGKEMRFGREKDKCKVCLNDENNINLVGVIDRLDVWNNYAKIIDYKTGKINNSLKALFVGKKLQLYLYLFAVKNMGYEVAGTFYFPIHNVFDKDSGHLFDDEIDEVEQSDDLSNEFNFSKFKLKGVAVFEKSVINAMDRRLNGEILKSDIVPIEIRKDGEISSRSSIVSQKQMNDLCDYSLLLAKEAVKQMLNGFVGANPFDDECKYCSFKNICMSNGNDKDYRKFLDKVSIDSISGVVANGRS